MNYRVLDSYVFAETLLSSMFWFDRNAGIRRPYDGIKLAL